MRERFKTTRVCSSDNYALSKKLHMDMLEENHEVFMKMGVYTKEEFFARVDIMYENYYKIKSIKIEH